MNRWQSIHLFVLLAFLWAGTLSAQPLLELKEVVKAPAQINSSSEESYPLISPDGRLYFVRSIFEGNVGGSRAGQDIWFVEPAGDGWSEATNELGKLNNIFNNGVVGIADSGLVLFLNSTYSNKLDYQIGLTKSQFVDGKWSRPERVRLKGFNPRSGFLSFYVDDERGVMILSFTDNMDDSEDLYVSLKQGGKWQKPLHMGWAINSSEAEFAPFLSDDGRVLYFSSTGHSGMGGADIFMSRRLDDTWLSWSPPVALEAPINSTGFDAYFTIHGTTAYFASNRDGDFSDVYIATYTERIQEARPELSQQVVEEQVPYIIVGHITDEKLGKLDGVEVIDELGKIVATVSADEKGDFVLENLPNFQRYYIDLKGKLADPSLTLETEEGQTYSLQREVDKNRFMFELGNREIKEVIQAQVITASAGGETSLFRLANSTGLSSSVRFSLLAANGKEVERTKPAADGSFEFKKMRIGEVYTIKAEGLSDEQLNQNVIGIKDSTEVEIPAVFIKGFPFKKLANGSVSFSQDDLLANALAAKFAFDYSRLDMAGNTVNLYDEKGNVLQKAFVNEKGFFAFSPLNPEGIYHLGFDGEGDLAKGLPDLFVINENGDRVLVAKGIMRGEDFMGDPGKKHKLNALRESFAFDYSNLPPAGTKVYLVDENGNIMDSSFTEAFGGFNFAKLGADGNYYVALANPNDLDLAFERYFIKDAEGKLIEIGSDGRTMKPLVNEEIALTTETFTFSEEGAPPAGTMVYLTDENDVVIDSAEVDESGEIRFLRLPADGNYKLKLEKTDDTSAGLSRFFIVDAEGQKVGFNEDGETSKPLVGKELAATTETFQFSDEGAPPAGTVVYLTDEEDNIIDSAVVSESGEIRFARLPADGNYKLKLEKTEDTSMGLGRFFIVDAEGAKVGFNEDGTTTKSLVGQDLAATTEKFTFSEEGAPPAGTVVYLTDENDVVIDSAVVDEQGEIRFTRLPPDGNYKLVLEKAIDGSAGLDRFFIVDAEGDKIGFGADGKTTKTIVGEELAKTTETFTFSEEGAPPEGTVVYLTDENDNVIDSAVVDESGEIRFTRLPPDGNYKLVLEKAVDKSMGLDRFFIVDGSGEKIAFNADGETSAPVVNSAIGQLMKFYSYDFKKLPPNGSKVYLLNADNHIIDSTFSGDEARFRFKRLNPNDKYGLEIITADGSAFNFGNMTLADKDGNSFAVKQTVSTESMLAAMRPEERAQKFDEFSFTPPDVPAIGTKLVFYDAAGMAVDSASVFSKGRVYVNRLPRGQTYTIKPQKGRVDPAKTQLVSLMRDKNRTLPYISSGYSYRPIDPILVPDPDPIVDAEIIDQTSGEAATKVEGVIGSGNILMDEATRLRLEGERPGLPKGAGPNYPPLPAEIAAMTPETRLKTFDQFRFDDRYLPDAGKKVTIEDDRGNLLATADIFEGGVFFVNKPSSPTTYYIKVDDETFTLDGAAIYHKESNGSDLRLPYEDQSFVYTPTLLEKVREPSQEFVISLMDDGTVPAKQPGDKEPYPLTPPVDQTKKVVDIKEDDKVAKTVFEKPVAQVEEDEKKPTMAKGVMDASDYLLKSGIPQVVETQRGYNMHFDFNSFLLTDYQIDYVYKVVIPILRENPEMILTLEGHTDSIGSADVNYKVSILRISNVLYHLEMAGIEDTRIRVVPKGEAEPVAPNNTEIGRALNRRVEFIKEE